MPKKKPTEQEAMNKAYEKSTQMPVVQPGPAPAENTGKTEFAKDVYKDIPVIQPNPGA